MASATKQNRGLYMAIVVLIALVIIVSGVAGLFYYEYSQASSQNSAYVQQLKALKVDYTTNIVIGYGNGTWKWYNDTQVPPGSNLYSATVLATNGNVNSTCCEYGSHLVTGIGGDQMTSSTYWWLWTYAPKNTTSPWQEAPVGPDELTITNNSVVFAWGYCGSSAAGNPTCNPP
jgi:heme/copper-type cytochrome/quinol oxidase subunit 2